ncbi:MULTISPECIES: hypothetical protein [Serratia]|uniref:Uncharacterized protein n=1 Tax=Serratia nematodiphila TaxID=458197 RepID=A0A1G5I4T8_9GAMM|nr:MULTISPECIES: hypothetical protein [Serratia]ALL36707.1 hypothetical protein AR325_06930 [Serratia marcescens]KFF86452.1 hypothetical protein JL05_24180 [Serratia nematodiphila DZ0503SBS1]MDP8822450.1 hypothetical protein [Serratia marcescens]MDT0207223.1 hypothetical protein [Serratia marcescens]MDV5742092.1 hypothetical protein [Serratia marcescens]
MKTPEEWAADLQQQLHALDNTPASLRAKKKTIAESQKQAHQMISAQAGLILKEKKARIKEYSNAIRLVAMEEIQREFALRHVKMLQDAEIKYAQREKKRSASNAQRLQRMKRMRSNTPPLTGKGMAILLVVCAPLSLYGLWASGRIFWHGLQTGELIFRSGCRPHVACLSHIVRATEPFNFYAGMTLFLFFTLLCTLMLLGTVLALSEAGKTPESKQ